MRKNLLPIILSIFSFNAIFAQSEETFTVTLDHNKGVGDPEQITVVYNQPMPENIGLVAPTRKGYEFTGYSRNGIYYYDADMKSVCNFNMEQDYTLYADWKARTTTVNFDFQGGENGTAQVIATYGKAMPTDVDVVAPTRTGYIFDGYYPYIKGKGNQYYNADMASMRSLSIDVAELTLYANWKARTTTVNFDFQGGENGTVQVIATYGKAMPTGENVIAPTRVGYIFGGYYPYINGNGNQYYNADMASMRSLSKDVAELTLYAKWIPEVYYVEDISLSETAMDLWIDTEKTLTATIVPTNATITAVEWSSSDNNIATVSSEGVVTAKGVGTAIITCKATDGSDIISTCEVTVKQQITSIEFDYETLTVTPGMEKVLAPNIYPSNASVQTLNWESKNTSVATVTPEGVLKAIAPGTAEIVCTTTDGSEKAAAITVEVVLLKITDSKPVIAEGTYDVGGISYIRTLTEGKYFTFCMPYTVNLNDYTEEFSKVFVPMGMAFLKPNGTLIVAFKKIPLTETIEAGKPFVVLAAKSETVSIVNAESETVTSLINPEPTSLDVYNWNGSSGFFEFNPDITTIIGGTYSKLKDLDNEKYYKLSTGGGMSKTTTVSPYRLYVQKEDNNCDAKITDIVFSFDEDEMTTGVEELQMTNDELPVYYNLSGQRINKTNVQNGIYIKNGKKYVK